MPLKERLFDKFELYIIILNYTLIGYLKTKLLFTGDGDMIMEKFGQQIDILRELEEIYFEELTRENARKFFQLTALLKRILRTGQRIEIENMLTRENEIFGKYRDLEQATRH